MTPPNKGMKLTKRASLAGRPALARLRRATFIESRFAAERGVGRTWRRCERHERALTAVRHES